MSKNNDFQSELKTKIKPGIKPSDLKSMPKNIFKKSNTSSPDLERLETERTELLEKLESYEKEQKLAVTTFKQQERTLKEKDQQLTNQEEVLAEKEEAITKLKTRIHELAKELNFLKKFDTVSEEVETTNIGTQTTGKSPIELEEEILEKRLDNLKDFGSYREQLAAKDQEITQLNNQITLYQEQIKKLLAQPNPYRKKVLVLTALLIITIALLIFK